MKLYCPECQSVYEDVSLEQCPADGAKLFALEATQEDPLLDAVIDGRFRIESLLGRGGMGAVYKGKQLSVGRAVAVKVLRNELLDREVALERFYRESKIISELTHPNIVRLIDFGQDRERDLLYLVMELVDGLNLGDMLETGRFKVAMALEVVYQVCGALTEPHARGVIHRDLKPDNLLIVPVSDGTIQVKVLDFGIARALETNTQLTATGMVCGTPQYMAPEQAQNQEIGGPTDLYALGVILYEMLSGAPPFHGQNSLQVMLQQIQRTPEPLAGMLPPGALPAEVEDLVDDMLAKDAERRPQSAREVRDRIDAIRRSYDLPPVRLAAGQSNQQAMDHWMLPPLPKANVGSGSGGTEALRRETGLERKPHRDTDENDLALGDTMGVAEAPATAPLPAEQRVRIYADRRRETPPEEPPVPPTLITEPSTHDDRTDSFETPAASPDATYTVRQEAAGISTQPAYPRPQKQESKLPLLGLAGVVGVGILIAIGAIVFIATSGSGATDEDPDTSKVVVEASSQETGSDTPAEADTAPTIDPAVTGSPEEATDTTPSATAGTPTKTAKSSKTKKTSKTKKSTPKKATPKEKVEPTPVDTGEPTPPEKNPDPPKVEKDPDPVVAKKDPPKTETKTEKPKKKAKTLDELRKNNKKDADETSKKLGNIFGK